MVRAPTEFEGETGLADPADAGDDDPGLFVAGQFDKQRLLVLDRSFVRREVPATAVVGQPALTQIVAQTPGRRLFAAERDYPFRTARGLPQGRDAGLA